jgi:hypothetical protein
MFETMARDLRPRLGRTLNPPPDHTAQGAESAAASVSLKEVSQQLAALEVCLSDSVA